MTTIFIDLDGNKIKEVEDIINLSNGDFYELDGEEYEVQHRRYNDKEKQYYIMVA